MLSRSDIIPWSFQIIFITVIFVTPGIPSASEDHVWNKVREVLPDALLKRYVTLMDSERMLYKTCVQCNTQNIMINHFNRFTGISILISLDIFLRRQG